MSQVSWYLKLQRRLVVGAFLWRWRALHNLIKIAIRYITGNYCGPYWSNGTFQQSVVGSLKPLDELDSLCQEHDASYARGEDIDKADYRFIEKAEKLGFRGYLFSNMVKANMKLRGAGPQKKLAIRAPADTCSIGRPTFAPSAISRNVSMRKPQMRSVRGSTIVTHKEYVGTVNNATVFTATSYAVNPGITTTFPWLSALANNYDQYRILALRFSYVSASSTSTSGRVTLAFNYNALDAAPSSKQQIFSITPNTEDAVWNSMTLTVPSTGQVLYTRQFLPVGGDLKTYDMGSLIFASDLGANTNTVGEIYVEYTVEFLKPHPQSIISGEVYSTTSTLSAIFTSPSLTGTRILIPLAQNTNNVIQILAPGTYLFNWWISGTVLSAAAFSQVVSNGSYTSVATAGNDQLVNGAATKYAFWDIAAVTVDSNNHYFQSTVSINATTVTAAYVIIVRLDPTVTYL